MNQWLQRYSKTYLQARECFDRYVQRLISQKEVQILENPYAHPLLKSPFLGVRRYKGGKLRIYYTLSTENPSAWHVLYGQTPQTNELIFLYVDMRSDDTYTELYKELKRAGPF